MVRDVNERDAATYRAYFERARRGEIAEGPNVLCPDCGTWMGVAESKTHECEGRKANT